MTLSTRLAMKTRWALLCGCAWLSATSVVLAEEPPLYLNLDKSFEERATDQIIADWLLKY